MENNNVKKLPPILLDEMSDEVVRAVNEMFAPKDEVEVLDEF